VIDPKPREFWELTEPSVVNEWIRPAVTEGRTNVSRRAILRVLAVRFPGTISEEVACQINQEEDFALLDRWFDTAVCASTFGHFLEAMNERLTTA
jgi:hypothetical protein